MIKHDIFDNSIDQYIILNPKRKQLAFFPKEENQMFKGVSYNLIETNSVNTETPSDYIGATTFDVNVILNDDIIDVKYIKNYTSIFDLFQPGESKLNVIENQFQFLKIPKDIFQTILTDSTEIENNRGSNIKWNYGTYFIFLEPKSVITNIITVNQPNHETTIDNTNLRRTLIETDKNDFFNTYWNFETNPEQSGRLYGSIVEIWNSDLTVLKQTKIIAENRFNFNNSDLNSEFVLTADIIGYDADNQAPITGDVLKIYPRETYFEKIIIELNFKNEELEASTFISYMLNDVIRDMKNGIYEIYDKNGYTIDASGNFNGNIIQRYQILQKDNYELRKKLK